MFFAGGSLSNLGRVTVALLVGLVVGAVVGPYLVDSWPWIGSEQAALVFAGLIVALGGGYVAAEGAVKVIRQGRMQTRAGNRRATWVGVVERGFFLVATAVSPPVAIGGVVGWAGLKLGANWESRDARDGWEAHLIRIGRVSALVGSLASLVFAVLGGLLVRWGLCP